MTIQRTLRLERIRTLLDLASEIADEEAQNETKASDPFTSLQQLIDTALARADEMKR